MIQSGAETVVRLTGDCPFSDPNLIDEIILNYRRKGGIILQIMLMEID